VTLASKWRRAIGATWRWLAIGCGRRALGRRLPTRRYTYGYGRAEDLAGIALVGVITLSSAAAAYAAVHRLLHPRPVSYLAVVAVAAALGFVGNEAVARYRICTGRRIGSVGQIRLRWIGHRPRAECDITVDPQSSASRRTTSWFTPGMRSSTRYPSLPPSCRPTRTPRTAPTITPRWPGTAEQLV
jgi:Cation efflux family